jgi:hypothetical protein
MKARRPKLVLPVALVATAASSCCFPGPRGPCDSGFNDSCFPDGGYVCPAGSIPERDDDGGWRTLPDGSGECAPMI